MKRIVSVSAALLFLKTFAFAVSFHSEGKESIVPPGIYDELYDDGRANLAVVLDEFGMVGGVGDGVSLDYTGSGRLNEVNGIRIYKKGASLTGIGDIYADINMNFTAQSSSSVAGIFLRGASLAGEKFVFVDKIDVFSTGNSFATSTGINNYDSFIGGIKGRSDYSEIRAQSTGNSSFGIWNQVGAEIAGISDIAVTAMDGKSQTYAIRNDYGSQIGNISNAEIASSGYETSEVVGIYTEDSVGNLNGIKIEVSGAKKVYGAFLNWGSLGNLSDSSISSVGGTDTIGIYNAGGSFGELSNVKIYASGDGYAAGILLLDGGSVSLKNSSYVSAESSADSSAYSIANESAATAILKGDSTIHTLNGDIYSDGKLVFDGNFKLQNADIELGAGMDLSENSSLSWNGKLVIGGGTVVIGDGVVLNVYLEEPLVSGEYMVMENNSSIVLSDIDMNVFDSGGQILENIEWELRHFESGDQLWIKAAVPEPSVYAAVLGFFSLVFAVCRARK